MLAGRHTDRRRCLLRVARAMPCVIASSFCGDTVPSLLSAAAIERGVGWRWRRASLLSWAVEPAAAFAFSLASMRASML